MPRSIFINPNSGAPNETPHYPFASGDPASSVVFYRHNFRNLNTVSPYPTVGRYPYFAADPSNGFKFNFKRFSMSRSNKIVYLFAALSITLASTQMAHAWSFIVNTLNSPYNQCMTCHTSNTDFTMNPYGADYLEPSHASRYSSNHPSPIAVTGDCNNCHGGRGYPILRAGLDDIDSDLDLFTNLEEFNAGTFPGDATDFPIDSTAPTITAFALPATSNTLTVTISSFTATDDVGVTGYIITESNTAPAVGDAGWSSSAPATYVCATADIYTLYAWAKDAAGNISASSSAQVDTTPSQQRVNEPPVASAGVDQSVTEGETVTLSGVGSTDDLGIATYAWRQLDGPAGSPIVPSAPEAVTLSSPSSITPYFVTPPVSAPGSTLTFELTVTDGDGAQDSAEVAITVNDNGISLFDSLPGVVSTYAPSGDPVGIGAAGNNACTEISTLQLQDMPSAAIEPQGLLYGIVDFELQVNDPANSTVTIYFPAPVPADYKWYKYTAAKGWFDFDRNLISSGTGEGAVFNNDRTQLTLYITDNSEHDDDATVGIIRDPGGLASGTTASSSLDVGSNAFGGNSGGAGCFIEVTAEQAGLSLNTIVLLLGALLLLVVAEIRRAIKS
jgi:hypothetical protein